MAIVVRPRTFDEVEITLECGFEEDASPEESFASGDDAADAEACREIHRRLDNGDVWAWCCVTVKATWRGYVGYATLGGCSYADEADFMQPDGYYDDMRQEALDNLNALLREHLERLDAILAELRA